MSEKNTTEEAQPLKNIPSGPKGATPVKKPVDTSKKKKDHTPEQVKQEDDSAEPKGNETKKAPAPKSKSPAKKAPAPKAKPPAKKPPAPKAKPPAPKAKPPAKKTPAPKAKPPEKKAPASKAKQAKPKVVPPRIGSRRGYRPFLSFRLLGLSFAIACLVCLLLLFLIFQRGRGPVGRYGVSALSPLLVELTIEPGMSAKAVSRLLAKGGVVTDDRAVLKYFIDHHYTTSLRSGTFVLEKGMAYEAIARVLTGKTKDFALVVSPAFTLAAIDTYLVEGGYAKKGEFLKAAEALRKEHSLSFAEGWLLSGKYVVSREDSAASLAQAMFSAMLETVQPHLGSEQIALWGLEQTLIIASMIQAETQNKDEMPLIASVIYNRLKAGQPLGIDATTRYELDDWKNPIPKIALEAQTPYNTRRRVGLPPTGICSPSKAAVEAALFPLDSPYFYYLHGPDKRIHPAITGEEHKQNIRAYL